MNSKIKSDASPINVVCTPEKPRMRNERKQSNLDTMGNIYIINSVDRNAKVNTRKRRRNGYQQRGPPIFAASIFLMVMLLVIWCGLQWNFYSRLEAIISDGGGYYRLPQLSKEKSQKMDHKNYRFLIFHRIFDAQGAGNHAHGLLAAHLLADEFDRIVCVSGHYSQFHLAFEPINPLALEHCPDILERHNREPPDTREDHTIILLNYRPTPVNECHVRNKLASSARVLHLMGNTYPRWSHIPPHISFFQFYKAKPILLDILPYPQTEPPPIVVHLRRADDEGSDARKGLDGASLRALGELLPVDASQHSPFLVTNNVLWYKKFEKEYGWSHPIWDIVLHSALGYIWEGQDKPEFDNPQLDSNQKMLQKKYSKYKQEFSGTENWEDLKLWADWYTLLTAQKVYHTYSDFSLSAVHWQSTWSRTYDGIDPETGKMLLLEENWISDGETARLVDRARDELKNCDVRETDY